jgi:RNA polymerase sigma factor (sigma-70 family)
MARLDARSPDAASELVQQYGDVILRVIRSRLNRLLRRQLDSQDLQQIVWASFFAHRDLYSRFDTPEQLLAFLRSIAANKVIDECRRRIAAARRSRLRERGLDSSGIPSLDVFVGREPSPSAAVGVRDQLAQLSPQERRIVEMRVAGESNVHIAEELRVSERTVYRVLQALARRQVR